MAMTTVTLSHETSDIILVQLLFQFYERKKLALDVTIKSPRMFTEDEMKQLKVMKDELKIIEQVINIAGYKIPKETIISVDESPIAA